MQCEKCREYIHEYIDQSLAEDQMLPMAEHFRQCADCQAFLNEELNFTQITATLFAESTSSLHLKESVKNNIINFVRENKQTIRFSYPLWAKVATVALLTGILFAFFSNKKQESKIQKFVLAEHAFSSEGKANKTKLELQGASESPASVLQNINQQNKHFKSICTTYDTVNKKLWVRRNIIVENPNGKVGFMNITVTRTNSGQKI